MISIYKLKMKQLILCVARIIWKHFEAGVYEWKQNITWFFFLSKIYSRKSKCKVAFLFLRLQCYNGNAQTDIMTGLHIAEICDIGWLNSKHE